MLLEVLRPGRRGRTGSRWGVFLAPENNLIEESGVCERGVSDLRGFGPGQWGEWSCLLLKQVKLREDWFKGVKIQRLVSNTLNLVG